jgi:tripartite-type tricarboxylate transporter receptor subunit TctC
MLTVLAWGAAASAQDADHGTFPAKPVRLLVPFPPGGAVDIVARTLGDELTRRWGQQVVIENRPGAGGIIASQAAAQLPADGYTLILVATGHALNPYFYVKLPYDPFNDFTPISLVGFSPNMLLVRSDSPFKSVAETCSPARANGRAIYPMGMPVTAPRRILRASCSSIWPRSRSPRSPTRAARPRSMI